MSTTEADPVATSASPHFAKGLRNSAGARAESAIEWRWSGGDIVHTRRYAAQLVQLAPDVLLANGTPATAALKQATSTIPIVLPWSTIRWAQG